MRRREITASRWTSAFVVLVGLALGASDVAVADKVWTVGDPINTPTISAPADGTKVGLGTRLTCTCNTPYDKDHWQDGCYAGNWKDEAVEATWSHGDAGGTWVDGKNTGPTVTYVTPNAVGNVTLKVTFDDTGTTQADDPAIGKEDTVTIEVVDAKMVFKVEGEEASKITRTAAGTFEVVDSQGNEIQGATYGSWAFDGYVQVSDPTHTDRTWTGPIVQAGAASCSVTFGGNTVPVSKTIKVNAREEGWSITPTCLEDPNGELDWGVYPGYVALGANRDQENDSPEMIWPRGTNFQNGYTTAEVTGGPNDGVWYISACTFAIARETLINKFIKPNAAGVPDPPNVGWYEYNWEKGVDVVTLLPAARGHEGYGYMGNGHGHQKFLEDEEAKEGLDARAAIEDRVAGTEGVLKLMTGLETLSIDNAIHNAALEEPTGNWGPDTIWIYDFDPPDMWVDYILGI